MGTLRAYFFTVTALWALTVHAWSVTASNVTVETQVQLADALRDPSVERVEIAVTLQLDGTSWQPIQLYRDVVISSGSRNAGLDLSYGGRGGIISIGCAAPLAVMTCICWCPRHLMRL